MAHCVTRVSVQEHWHASRERNHGPHVQPPVPFIAQRKGQRQSTSCRRRESRKLLGFA